MGIVIKKGASIDDCGAEILRGLISVEPVFTRAGVDVVVTSGSENYPHTAKRSAHYRGDAVDLRIKHVHVDKRGRVVAAIKRKLGPNFVVIHECKGTPQEHIHIHWSPVYAGV